MSPLRWDVLAVSFVLALPLLGLWARGEFTVDEVTGRLPWCFLAGWAVVALLRYAATPPKASPSARKAARSLPSDDEASAPTA
jgi:hypothetical protein